MHNNYTNSPETPHIYSAEQKKPDSKKTHHVSLLRQSTVRGKSKLWGKESSQQVPLGSNDWRGHSTEAPGAGAGPVLFLQQGQQLVIVFIRRTFSELHTYLPLVSVHIKLH